ncbi:unnamed protein product [Malus baccata var. baccata]
MDIYGHFNPTFNLKIALNLLCLCLASVHLQTSKLFFADGLTNTVKLCIDEERVALVSFKQGLTDPSGKLSSWSGQDCCQWEGILCNNLTGHVAKMDLRNTYVTDPQMAYGLEYEDWNDFKGIRIPNFFGELKTLRYLNISSSSFGGEIPPSLGNLSNLNFLDLSARPYYSSLLEIPSENLNWLSRLSSLQYLNLGGLSLANTGVSWLHVINMFPSLLELHLSSCEIGNLPQITLKTLNFTSLLALDMSSNFISSFPSWLFNLTVLTKLHLRQNSLSGLDFSGNRLEGHIPKLNFCKLKTQNFQGNKFDGGIQGLLSGFLNCTDSVLESLDLSSNKLEDELPDSLGMLHNLQYVNLEFNNFSGKIPESIGKLSSLKTLNLNYNNMIGPVPDTLGQLPELVHLDLSGNSWEGILTESHFANLTRLRSIDVMWPLMLIVDVGYNNLSGNIPSSMGVPSSLLVLRMNDNNLGGTIPSSVWRNCTSLRSIDLGGNKFTGNMTLWIGSNAPGLFFIRLRSNLLSGHISDQLCNLPLLDILDPSHNNFSGPIPKCLKNMMSLVEGFSNTTYYESYIEQTTLTLKGRELVFNKTLFLVKSIDLSSNNLEGEIPEEITSLIALSTLNLSRNQLRGNIPLKIGNLRWLETLDLSHNHLSGQIPQSLSSLTSLSYLNLSYNNLAGRIPSGNQLQTLEDPSIYEGNLLLCGVPLSTKCPGDDTFTATDAKDSNEDGNDKLWFYVSMVLGFTVGFWGVCGTLLVKKSWRYTYFRLFDDIKDKVMLAIAVKVAHFQRKL